MTGHDVAVVGGGVVGCAVASALVRAGFDVALLEAGPDVGAGTSKANTAIWHTGFDAKPGTLEARLVARGHGLLAEAAERFGFAVERTGAVLVAWDDEQRERLPGIRADAQEVGYDRVEPLRPDEVYRLEPSLGPGATGGLLVPDEGLLDPWGLVVALATDVVVNGGTLRRGARVTGVGPVPDGGQLLSVAGGAPTVARWVVNAAGLASDEVDRLVAADLPPFTVTPRRGQLVVFDKVARALLRGVVLPVPTATTKGVLVSPTVYGNVLLGPTAEDLADKSATGTTPDGLADLLAAGGRVMPALVEVEVTALYAGLRAATASADYCYGVDAARRYVRLGGIRSTGVSAALALAEQVVTDLAAAGEQPRPLAHPVTVRVPSLAEDSAARDRPRPYLDPELVAADPAYGEVVCHCEKVTLGEVRDALASPVPPVDLDGLRRRTRAVAGRCQGFHCGARLTALLEGAAVRR